MEYIERKKQLQEALKENGYELRSVKKKMFSSDVTYVYWKPVMIGDKFREFELTYTDEHIMRMSDSEFASALTCIENFR